MKYFFISDVHGYFDKMIKALNDAGFDKSKDTLVNLGDPFDRGSQSKEVLEYLMSCPHRILIWGNHDLRLRDLLYEKDYPAIYDFENGVPATLKSFTLIGPQAGLDMAIYLFLREDCYLRTRKQLFQYFRECHYAVEFKDLIGVHAWVPTIEINKNVYRIDPEWRNASAQVWEDIVWCHSELRWHNKALPDKPLIIGHWFAWKFAINAGEKRANKPVKELTTKDYINCDIWKSKKGELTAIDGCSTIDCGKVNVFVYESDEPPVLYRADGKTSIYQA